MISRMPVRPETASVFHGETSLLLYHSVRSFSKHSLPNVAPRSREVRILLMLSANGTALRWTLGQDMFLDSYSREMVQGFNSILRT